MPALVVHLAVVERLAQDGRGLPAELVRTLQEDLEYARLGAALPDLPFYEGLAGAVRQLRNATARPPPFARLFHAEQPVALGLKLAELVATGSLVGSHAGRAVVAGYFTHLVLDRRLHPLTELLAARLRGPGESARQAHQRVEAIQASLYLREAFGEDLLGKAPLAEKLRVLKRPGAPFFSGLGRGMYELIRTGCQEVWGVAPEKPTIDAWLRGLYFYVRLASSPLAAIAFPAVSTSLYRHTFDGPELDLVAEMEKALREARKVVSQLYQLIGRADFSPRAAGAFTAQFPEGAAGSLLA